MFRFQKESRFPISAEELFGWHEQPGAFERLAPPWEKIVLKRRDPSLAVGAEVHLLMHKGPFTLTWIAKHTEYEPPHHFTDIQWKGPFKKWIHRHEFIPDGPHQSRLIDTLTYQPPTLMPAALVKGAIEKMFTYRHEQLRNDLQVVTNLSKAPLKIGIGGGDPHIIFPLAAFLKTGGHTVYCLPSSALPPERLDRWVDFAPSSSHPHKEPPKIQITLLSSELGEKTPPPLPIKQVDGTYGCILTTAGGLLPKLLPLFPFRRKTRWEGDTFDWISLDDFVYTLSQLILDGDPPSSFTIASAEGTTLEEITKNLKKLGRPLFHLPPIFGWGSQESCTATRLSGHKVSTGFFPTVEATLRHTLGKFDKD